MKTSLVLSAMLRLVPATHQAEPEAEALDRYKTIADAIASEAKGDAELARYLVTVARHESAFRRDVHTCKVTGDAGRSFSLFQILTGKRGTDRFTGRRGRELCGTDRKSTARAVDTAAAYLRFARKRCKRGNPVCVFKVYGGVKRASDPRIVARLNTYARLSTWGKP